MESSDNRELAKVLRVPESQEERVSSARLGIVSVAASAGLILLKGVTGMFLPGFLISAAIGVMGYWVYHKKPEWKGVGMVIGGSAVVTLLNAIPALRGLGGFIIGAGAFVAGAFGIWKLASVIVSIFRRKR